MVLFVDISQYMALLLCVKYISQKLPRGLSFSGLNLKHVFFAFLLAFRFAGSAIFEHADSRHASDPAEVRGGRGASCPEDQGEV